MGLACSPAAGPFAPVALALGAELENQRPTATTPMMARKIHDCICFGITPVAAFRLSVTGAAAGEGCGFSGTGVGAVVDMAIHLAFQMWSCACLRRDSLFRRCGR